MPGLAGLFFCLIMNSELKNIKKLIIDKSLELDCGKTIKNFPLAYEAYGTLNKNKDNAILAFHALTGDQFCTNINPIIDIPENNPIKITARSTFGPYSLS